MSQKREQAIKKRRIFLITVSAVLIVVILLLAGAIKLIANSINKSNEKDVSEKEQISDTESAESEELKPQKKDVAFDDTPDMVTLGEYTLDANFKKLLLVNADHPLPEDYDYTGNLVKIEAKYHNGQLDMLDKDIWPYMKAMIEKAWEDGVDLKVWSPYRAYNTQKMLFENMTKKVKTADMTEQQAQDKAATIVARPGTSEHHTGFATDFNMADDKFEQTPMFEWLQKNAQDYGFILRYPKNSQDKTGVIYESWHYRFVGINVAKEIKSLGVTLEEYLEIKGIE